ncbi:MAG TPA: hypothetical protein VGL81_19010 [Polyangiaceae bacterium]|jgi:hypothetical protein
MRRYAPFVGTVFLVACGASTSNGGGLHVDAGGDTGGLAYEGGAGGKDGGMATSPDGGGGACGPYGSGVFEVPNVWTTDVSCETPSPSSASIIAALTAAGGWGPGMTQFQIDTSLVVLHATSTTPMVPFTMASGYTLPDCDTPTQIPLVTGGAIEGQTNYTCDVSQNDCHLLVVYPPTSTLYELYQATSQGSGITAGCAILWDLTKTYPPNERGDQCTSADAAGFPMSAMLTDADEVATGTIGHAIRFALPNARMAKGVYVHPASHAGGPSGSSALPPYGARFRLRANYPVSSLASPAAQTIAKALQRFGMFLSDGGNIPLMVQSDQLTTHKWTDATLNLDSHALFGIQPSDFDVVDLGPPVTLTYNCVRNP